MHFQISRFVDASGSADPDPRGTAPTIASIPDGTLLDAREPSSRRSTKRLLLAFDGTAANTVQVEVWMLAEAVQQVDRGARDFHLLGSVTVTVGRLAEVSLPASGFLYLRVTSLPAADGVLYAGAFAGIPQSARAKKDKNPTTIAKYDLLGWWDPALQDDTDWQVVTVGGAPIVPDLSGSNAPTKFDTGGPNGGPYVRFTAADDDHLVFQGALGGEFDRVWIYAWLRYPAGDATSGNVAMKVSGTGTVLQFRVSAGPIYAGRCTPTGESAINMSSSETIDTDWHLAVIGLDGEQLNYRHDEEVVTPVASTGAMDMRNPGGYISFGAQWLGGGNAPAIVDIATVVMMSAAPDAEVDAEMMAFMEAA